ncbi:aldo/keto reductase [Azomonas macrocytogenes]|uniref:Diketogulonate reductase-like aldo/keto reductase n=1 Tax=Azomonas macrocytogenes TaxID=69962 RepID=A0A839T943_AZOMA|nr:aldo/keto reductase [Azomonas macrocytogenes]MBB3104163.1 diketogulonate reductase-like aldo/keto reductase [Azomonas macrocytogenes]
MQTRRQFIKSSTTLAAMATLAPWLPASVLAAEGLIKRKIPSSGEELPVIGLGTSRTFDVAAADNTAMAPLEAVLQTFVEGGATLIDTAPSYGRAEQITGELIHRLGARDKLFLATKVSSVGRDAGRKQIQASFKALQTERIDLIQVHNLLDTRTQLALLREMKEMGKVRYIGITHYVESSHDDLLEVLQKEKVDFVQFNYSVGARNAENRLLPYCADHGIATLVNRAYMQGNLLTNVKDKPLPPLAKELQATSWAQLLLKFVIANPAVTTVIPATANPRYMADNLLAGRGPLPDAEQREQIVKLFS